MWNFVMKAVQNLVVYGFITICVVLLLQVIARYVFNKPFVWSEELALFLLAWLCFFGCGYGVHQRLHIRMSTMVKLLPLLGQKLVATFVDIVCIAAFSCVIPSAFFYFYRQLFVFSPALRLSYGIVYISLPLGFIILIVSLIIDIIRTWKGDVPID
jgi:TRAP-type C4-dicarboxylate transport system permease small subunit